MTKPTGRYAWLNAEPGPRMLLEALKLYGTLETPGTADNPVILAWADEIGTRKRTAYAAWAANWYADDSVPWCGLFMAVCAVRANVDNRFDRRPPNKYLSAAQWAHFGDPVGKDRAELGDVLVFVRPGGGHVALYVGEDAEAYHCLGGNQGDAVSITRIAKTRCTHVRRVPYLAKPANVRKVHMGASGPLSANED
jgi:uncharacterized protein (TIGR02594 family)